VIRARVFVVASVAAIVVLLAVLILLQAISGNDTQAPI